MTCRNCKHTKPGPMTKHGFQSCAKGPVYEYFPGGHTCAMFEAKAVVVGRVAA